MKLISDKLPHDTERFIYVRSINESKASGGVLFRPTNLRMLLAIVVLMGLFPGSQLGYHGVLPPVVVVRPWILCFASIVLLVQGCIKSNHCIQRVLATYLIGAALSHASSGYLFFTFGPIEITVRSRLALSAALMIAVILTNRDMWSIPAGSGVCNTATLVLAILGAHCLLLSILIRRHYQLDLDLQVAGGLALGLVNMLMAWKASEFCVARKAIAISAMVSYGAMTLAAG